MTASSKLPSGPTRTLTKGHLRGALLAGSGLAALLLSPAQAQAQTWTGAEVLTGGDWIEQSHDAGPNGSRQYQLVGDSLRWLAGASNECVGLSPYSGRCITERTFALPLASSCQGPVEVAYHYTRETSDNDFFVGVGSATQIVQLNNGDGYPFTMQEVGFTSLTSPYYSDASVLTQSSPILPAIDGEVWVSGSFTLDPGSWDISASAYSTDYPNPTNLSTTTAMVPGANEQLYVFLIAGDRHEQYVLHSVEVTGCEVDVCGDGVVSGLEQCDDGNTDETDGCLSSCQIPSTCLDIKVHDDQLASGTYAITPPGENQSFNAYCDMTTDGGGWTSLVHHSSLEQLNFDLPHQEVALSEANRFWVVEDKQSATYQNLDYQGYTASRYGAWAPTPAESGWLWEGIDFANYPGCHVNTSDVFLLDSVDRYPRTVNGEERNGDGYKPAGLDAAALYTASTIDVAPVVNYPAVAVGCIGYNVLVDPVVWLR